MARFEKDLGGSAPEPLSLTQLLALLGANGGDVRARNHAVACFVAGGDGWEQALHQLRGAFAAGEHGASDESE